MEELRAEGWRLDSNAAMEVLEENQKLRNAVLDTDLKLIGERALPLQDKAINRLVLQVDHAQNIGPSLARGKRILRLKLTDGHSLVTAVEYKAVPSLNDDIPPGTKVLLKGARVHSGIVLLDDRCVQVLGGRVPVLYEAWEIQRKYSGSTRGLQPSTSQRPPVFGARHSEAPAASSGDGVASSTSKPEPLTSKRDPSTTVVRAVMETNPDAGPASNQAAARKLLEKRAEEAPRPRRQRQGRGNRDMEDDSALTLDEWEATKRNTSAGRGSNVVSDEEFARRLQAKLDLEAESPPTNEAEQIRLSMFSFNREEAATSSRARGRGRGGRRR